MLASQSPLSCIVDETAATGGKRTGAPLRKSVCSHNWGTVTLPLFIPPHTDTSARSIAAHLGAYDHFQALLCISGSPCTLSSTAPHVNLQFSPTVRRGQLLAPSKSCLTYKDSNTCFKLKSATFQIGRLESMTKSDRPSCSSLRVRRIRHDFLLHFAAHRVPAKSLLRALTGKPTPHPSSTH